MAIHCPDSLSSVARFMDGFSPERLDHLGDIYSPGVEFRDPVHESKGHVALRVNLEQRYLLLHRPSICVDDAHGDERTGFLLWTMRYPQGSKHRAFTGTSHFKFAADGRVASQLDHWNAPLSSASGNPVVDWAVRGIKRMVKPRT